MFDRRLRVLEEAIHNYFALVKVRQTVCNFNSVIHTFIAVARSEVEELVRVPKVPCPRACLMWTRTTSSLF